SICESILRTLSSLFHAPGVSSSDASQNGRDSDAASVVTQPSVLQRSSVKGAAMSQILSTYNIIDVLTAFDV
ncbi:hypothetical protein, partial [Escherichia coli]|uniref:hypothetical protein n=1 Tax=Escherichia coli TaxID=562 RepID=UPI0019D51964